MRKLLEMQPTTARILKEGKELEVPIEEVQVGDLMRISLGEKIPTDGVIVEGRAAIDEKMLTGESVPIFQ